MVPLSRGRGMRRKLRWGLAALAIVLLVVFGFALARQPDPPRSVTSISRAAFHCVKEGMTIAEVTAILGPPGDYRTTETEIDVTAPYTVGDMFVTLRPYSVGRTLFWISDTATVIVGLDQAGKAEMGTFNPNRPSKESASSRLLKRAKRQWQQWFP